MGEWYEQSESENICVPRDRKQGKAIVRMAGKQVA